MSTKNTPRGLQAEKLLASLHSYYNDAKFRKQKEETMLSATDGNVTYIEVLTLHISNFLRKKSKSIQVGLPKEFMSGAEGKEEKKEEKKAKLKNYPWAKNLRSLFKDNHNTPLSSRAIFNTLFKDAAPSLKRKMKSRMNHSLWIYCNAGWLKKDKGEKGEMYSLNKGHLAVNN